MLEHFSCEFCLKECRVQNIFGKVCLFTSCSSPESVACSPNLSYRRQLLLRSALISALSLKYGLLLQANQMSKKKVSFTSLYHQLEDFYSYMEKESMRYSTLLRRANKVGGDRRMEKVILMPVYNKLVRG